MSVLVQRPRRKMHLATAVPEGWLTVCDRLVQPDAAVTPLEDAVATIDAHAGQVCVDCHRIVLMADVMTRLALARLGLAA